MPAQNIPSISFNQIVKHPISYALMIIVGLLSFFVSRYTGASDQVNKNCEAEKVELRKELALERSKNDQLITALLIKNGIIFQQEQDKKDLDSTIRNTLGPKVKKLKEK